MIVSFSLSNFRSFASEETLSLIASNRLGLARHDDHAVSIPGSKEKVLRTAVLYGANGAGKSNLLKALKYLKTIALHTRDKNRGTGRDQFVFNELSGEPSSFDLQFISNGSLYRFGIKVDDDQITEEWLVWIIAGKERTLYERATTPSGAVTIDAKGLKGAGEKIEALATIGGPPNQSFLATINSTLSSAQTGGHVRDVLAWFENGLNPVEPDQELLPIANLLDKDPEFKEFASEYVKAASTGVDHLYVTKEEFLPGASAFDEVLIQGNRLTAHQVTSFHDGRELVFDKEAQESFLLSPRAAHKQEDGTISNLNLSQESDGTRRLLNLLPALYQLRKTGGVFVIDEIDRSLHPILVWNFLNFFLKSGGLGQIVLTTHESNLLDLDLLRRDEIWFAEKDPAGATHLYSLLDFKVRSDLEIRKHYLQGRFGAIPFLGNLDRLLPKEL